MVGDTLKKANESPDGRLIEVKDFGDMQYAISFSYTRLKSLFTLLLSVVILGYVSGI